MKLLPKDLATALYLAVRDMDEKEAKAGIERFIGMMTARGQAGLLPTVLDALPDAAAAVDGIAKVTIETAREVDEKTVRAALKALGIDETAAEVATAVRPELIGGIRIKHEDSVYDASVAKRLRTLKAALSGTHA